MWSLGFNLQLKSTVPEINSLQWKSRINSIKLTLFYQGARKPRWGSETTNGRTENERRRGMVDVLYKGIKCIYFCCDSSQIQASSSFCSKVKVRPMH